VDLPEYVAKEELEEKIRRAIEEVTFGLV